MDRSHLNDAAFFDCNKVKFVSYDGGFPNLCRGKLILNVCGKRYELENALTSGGCVWFDDNFIEHIDKGPWSISLPPDLIPFIDEIERVVNENIPCGCYGGCV